MKQILKLIIIIFLGIFTAFNFISAQTATPPNGTINQNQLPDYTPYLQTPPTNSQKPSPTQTPSLTQIPGQTTTASPTIIPAPSSVTEALPQIKSQEIPEELRLPVQNTTAKSDFPSYLLYIIFPIIIIIALFWKKLTELMKKKSEPGLPAEDDGTLCPVCGGAGRVTKKRKRTEPCGHCKGTGNDICHDCGGTGKYSTGFTIPQTQEEVDSLLECPHCEGKGFPPVRNICEFCKGKGKIEFEESYEEAYSKCKGSGRIIK